MIKRLRNVFRGKKMMLLPGFLFLAGGMAGWFYSPISGYFTGFRLYGGKPDPALFLFSLMSVLLGVACVVSLKYRSRLFPFIISLFSVLMFSALLLYFSGLDLKLVATVEHDTLQYSEIGHFSLSYLPFNGGVEPTFYESPDVTDILGRLHLVFHSLSYGAYCFILGAMLLGVIAWINGDWKGRRVAVVISSLVILLPLLVVLVGETYWLLGMESAGKGSYAEALKYYRFAVRISPQLETIPGNCLKIGEAAFYTIPENERERALAYMYQASTKLAIDDYDNARMEAEMFLAVSPAGLKQVAGRYYGEVLNQQGLNAYKNKAFGAALAAWRRSTGVGPNPAAFFMMAKAYYDLAMYREALRENMNGLNYIKTGIARSQLYANIGDCYYQLRNPAEARLYYLRAFRSDNYKNDRAIAALSGT
jgi:hypothetical protein